MSDNTAGDQARETRSWQHERHCSIEDGNAAVLDAIKSKMNTFDQFLADTREDFSQMHWRQPAIEVADTMYVCKKWFEGHDVVFTAADLVAMARLVLERERSIREEVMR
jgi:hypothetical protein